jgi:hypothetical protein
VRNPEECVILRLRSDNSARLPASGGPPRPRNVAKP